MPFCPDCGTEHQGARFCPNCGIPQPGTTAPGAHAAVATPSAPASIPEREEEDEKTVWEGEAKTVTKAATRGHLVTARYQLTNKTLYFQEGALSTRQQQVPLWAVRDIDVERSLTQKARGWPRPSSQTDSSRPTVAFAACSAESSSRSKTTR